MAEPTPLDERTEQLIRAIGRGAERTVAADELRSRIRELVSEARKEGFGKCAEMVNHAQTSDDDSQATGGY